MLKETETEETIVFFVTFLSFVAFQLGWGGRAYDSWQYCITFHYHTHTSKFSNKIGPVMFLH